jgi:hypothetical protein
MGIDITINAAWKSEPVADEFKQMHNGRNFQDHYISFIIAEGIDGKRYCRAGEVTGRQIQDGSAMRRLNHVASIVTRDGPSLCTPIDGGDLPRESDQPPISY